MPSSSQAAAALNAERLNTQRELTERLRMENAMTRGDLLRKSELMKRLAMIADAFVSRLNAASEIPRHVRDDLLRDLATWPLVLEETAHAQTGRTKTGNEKAPKGKATTAARRPSKRKKVQA